MKTPLFPKLGVALAAAILVPATPSDPIAAAVRAGDERVDLGTHLVLSWNDLGMHCMNVTHATLSILPPYNNVYAQVIARGTETTAPSVVTTGITVSYSIPGNTYSVGKTDFWTYDQALFGVDLPDNVGLTGKGLWGELDPAGDHFVAEGIPITPFPDAMPTTEDPYQQARLIAFGPGHVELARSHPTVPVSGEIHCLGSGCHTSEAAILNAHEREGGFDPADTPILCARCHASPALGTPGDPEAKYLSFRIHDQHDFIDQSIPGIDGCYRCHPGAATRCFRGTMSIQPGMICQDCHGTIGTVARSIEQGRVPWLNEPACRTCHTATYGEPVGQLYRFSKGHGGVYCEGCHHSTHAEWPSREPRDNANAIALQGHVGLLADCTVCHGTIPTGVGPHGAVTLDVVENEVLDSTFDLVVSPNPMREHCAIGIPATAADSKGRLLVFDVRGRTVRMIEVHPAPGGALAAEWDGTRRGGESVEPGVYYLRWTGARPASARVLVTR
jgi:hypothetical protein